MNPIALDLTGTQYSDFNLSGFPEAIASFRVPKRIEESLAILIWGVLIKRPESQPTLQQFLPPSNDNELPPFLYLSGWGILQFNAILGGDAALAPCHPTFGNDLIFDRSSPLSREWPVCQTELQRHYLLSVILEQPLGHLSMNLFARGSVRLFLNADDCIPSNELNQSPDKFDYDYNRCRQLEELARIFKLDTTQVKE